MTEILIIVLVGVWVIWAIPTTIGFFVTLDEGHYNPLLATVAWIVLVILGPVSLLFRIGRNENEDGPGRGPKESGTGSPTE